jgi:hypothetical protein
MFCSAKTAAAPLGLRVWVLACALLNASGWVLSAVGLLNKAGYAAALVISAAIIYLCLRGRTPDRFIREERGRPLREAGLIHGSAPVAHPVPHRNFAWIKWSRLVRRFRRPFPLAFLVLAILALLGGVLYPPSNFDALAFRVPRVLHWLVAGHWHWMTDYRGGLNTRTCAFEWVSTPLLLFTNTDRWLFLVNVAAFLLLPGLVFSFLTRLGLSPRAACHWMWVFPAGMCFVLQAGSLGNDLFGAVMALAAMDFALRARGATGPANLRYSILTAALMTSAKISNLTLLLPWMILVLSSWRLLGSKPALALACAGLALTASFVPTALLNVRYCGDWTGMSAENAWLNPPSKAVCFTHNAALLAVQHLAPPVFPFASAWEKTVQKYVPESWKETLDGFAEEGRYSYRVRELPTEEHAGLGLGLLLLVIAQLVAAARRASWLNFREKLRNPGGRMWALFLVSGFLPLAVFMCKSGMLAISRIISPYYALLLPLVLFVTDSGRAVRTLSWRSLAGLVFAFAFIALVLNPARPLFPAQTLMAWAGEHFPGSRIVERAGVVYSVYRERHDVLAPLRHAAPESEPVLGLVTMATVETSLWRPFGTRRIVRLDKDTSPAGAQRLGVRYLVIDVDGAEKVLRRPVADWLQAMKGVVVTNIPIRTLAYRSSLDYMLVRLEGSSQ